MELPRREFLHLAAGRSSARRFSHSNPLLVLALLVLEERKHGEIFQRNYTTVARALDDTRAAARASLGRGLERADLLDHRLPQSLLGPDIGQQFRARHRIDVAGDILEALLRGRFAQHHAQIVADRAIIGCDFRYLCARLEE